MFKFVVITKRTSRTIEANDLDEAEKKCNERYKNWVDITIKNIDHIKEEVYNG